MGLEQKEVAIKLGVSENSVYNWENERALPRKEFLDRLYNLLF
jgi:transcriptional regulator with XRE-family HTH domain